MKYKVYHNPRCSKSRIAIEYLKGKNEEVEVVEYLKEIPSSLQLKEILVMLGMKAEELVRKGEAIYKEKYKGKELTDDQWIDAMIENPKLIERPIVIRSSKAVVARPVEKIEEL